MIENYVSVNMENADLAGKDFSNMLMVQSGLVCANLSGANLENVDLSDSTLTGANFTGAYLKGATLDGAQLVNTNFTNADMRGVSMLDVNMKNTVLTGADLLGARGNFFTASYRELFGVAAGGYASIGRIRYPITYWKDEHLSEYSTDYVYFFSTWLKTVEEISSG